VKGLCVYVYIYIDKVVSVKGFWYTVKGSWSKKVCGAGFGVNVLVGKGSGVTGFCRECVFAVLCMVSDVKGFSV